MTKDRGNILFLILLAVVLFAALAYAVTSSMRGGGRSAQAEQYDLMVSRVMQHATLLSSTIDRLKLVNDCRDTDIDLYGGSYVVPPSTVSNNYILRSPASPDKCKLYHASGGGMTYQSALSIMGNQFFPKYDVVLGRTAIRNVGTTCTEDSCTDLVWLIEVPDGLDKKAFCNAYNKITNGRTSTAQLAILGSGVYNGEYTYHQIQGAASSYDVTQCYPYDGAYDVATRYFIYYVLLAR